MQSPAVENFFVIEGRTYATGKDGKGLYRLVPEVEARFYNEAEPLNLNFRIKKKNKASEEIIKEINRLPH